MSERYLELSLMLSKKFLNRAASVAGSLFMVGAAYITTPPRLVDLYYAQINVAQTDTVRQSKLSNTDCLAEFTPQIEHDGLRHFFSPSCYRLMDTDKTVEIPIKFHS